MLIEYRRCGQPMPLAIALGGDPIDLLAAMAPLPDQADVLGLTGYLKDRPCELAPGRRVDLPVPADAEMVIEGTIDPSAATTDAGSGLDATGQLRPLRPGAMVLVEALTHRPTPIFPALLPEEGRVLRQSLTTVFLPLLRGELPGLVDLSLPAFGGAQRWAFASVDKTYPGQGMQFANAFWSLPKMIEVRYLVVVDEDVDVDDSDAVWAAMSAHAAPAVDVRLSDVPPNEFLDDQSPGRMVFDATRPLL
jgi:4-hydroxy-3-polyprenylbenzoate decarboxylase